jgi:homoserine dehydrogenase
MQSIKIGVLGAGTVAGGTWRVLTRNQEEITRRAGRGLEITLVGARDTRRARAVFGEAVSILSDLHAVARHPDIEIVIELIGGDTLARELVLEAIAAGKHVVTANKALLARHGNEIFAAARERGVMVAFEAAVGGGIPIIKALREGLTANRLEWLAGIINGTSNFVLSAMRSEGQSFDDALAEAQRLGYAEADPSFDVNGTDAAHKLSILAAIAFGIPVQFDACHVEGIADLAQQDLRAAEELGYRIKLLGIARRCEHGIELRVHPTLIPKRRLIASVEGVTNALLVQGDAVGATLYCGAGAGAEPTASAVVADLVDVTRLHTADPENRVPHLAFQAESLASTPILPIGAVSSAYYLRLRVLDRPGVLAEITRILADALISIGAFLQREPQPDEHETDIILLTHKAVEAPVREAIARIEALDSVLLPATVLRVEELAL